MGKIPHLKEKLLHQIILDQQISWYNLGKLVKIFKFFIACFFQDQN